MRWLLWKDYRQNRLIVFTALVLVLAPHLVALYATCRAKILGLPDASHWAEYLFGSAFVSLWISQAALVLIGANAIGSERVDRSSEFLFSLPITRRKLLSSKLLLALGIAAAPWLVNTSILWYVIETLPHVLRGAVDESAYFVIRGMMLNIPITGMSFFCAAWFLSSFHASPAYAVYGGAVTPLSVIGGIWYLDYLFEWHISGDSAGLWYRAICLTIAPPLFALGTWHYLRRVEP